MSIQRIASVLTAVASSLAFAQVEVAPNVIAPSSNFAAMGKVRSNHYFCGSARPAGHGPALRGFAAPDGLAPAQVTAAYGVAPGLGSGAIAVVIPFNLPSALGDFNAFSTQYALPTEASLNPTSPTNTQFQVVFAKGVQPAPSIAWGSLAALSIEWAHAVAPKAKVYLVEAASESLADVYSAVKIAKGLSGVMEVVMPWGVDEYAAEAADDGVFLQPGVTFFGSAGDFVRHPQYPAASPNVVGVGGTNLSFTNGVALEKAWDSSACGLSQYEARPAAQDPFASVVGGRRGTPDLVVVGDPLTSVSVYSSFAIGGWTVMGGTSLSASVAAAVANTRGAFSTGSAAEISRIYRYLGTRFFRDITAGSAGGFNAGSGYDILTGAGSPLRPYSALAAAAYLPTSATVEMGTLLSGNVGSLGTGDGNKYQVQSSPVTGASPAQVAQFSCSLALDRPASQMVTVSLITLASSATGATVSYYVYNNNTSGYDLIGAAPGSAANTSKTFTLSKWGPYYGSGNQMKIRVQATLPGASASAFTLGADQVRIVTSY